MAAAVGSPFGVPFVIHHLAGDVDDKGTPQAIGMLEAVARTENSDERRNSQLDNQEIPRMSDVRYLTPC